ncbi:hypothetical protein LCGC14_1797200 [marine sediment metagenome]|uniref:Type II toxin-antitoxin system PemK/MazF family toxin n=1 Tax=marine sediment metagenome TaxID=412755 RepID=A0A0F9J5H7_9ZZZZ
MYYDEGDVVYGDILYMRHKGKKTERPTIIILEEKKETVIIAPFSHKFKAGTYHLPVISPKEIVGKKLKYKVLYILVEETQEIERKSLQKKTQRRLKTSKFRQVLIFVRDAERTGKLKRMKGNSVFS